MQNNNVNDKIRARTVLLIDENGNNFGNVNISDALYKAQNVGLDLVEVSSGSKGVPVCRIMDLGKWKYEQSKKNKKNKSHRQEIKELKFRPTTGDNDLKYRAKRAGQFMEKGDKVKLAVYFRGREQEHMLDTGRAMLEKFISLVTVPFVIDSNARIEGNSITMIIALEKK